MWYNNVVAPNVADWGIGNFNTAFQGSYSPKLHALIGMLRKITLSQHLVLTQCNQADRSSKHRRILKLLTLGARTTSPGREFHGSKDRVETHGGTDRQTDGQTGAIQIALPSRLTRSVNVELTSDRKPCLCSRICS